MAWSMKNSTGYFKNWFSIQVLVVFLLMSMNTIYAQVPARLATGVVTDFENDSTLHTQSYKYMVESTSKLLSPKNVTNEQFNKFLEQIRSLRTPMIACNLFIPGELKVVGPKVDEKAVLEYVEIVFRRARLAGLSMIIWGSGGSRGVPEGFDRTEAKVQFVSMAKKIGAVAARYNIIVALESLNSTECNFINTVKEAAEIIKSVNHPNIRLCVDIYHMLMEGEGPESILGARGFVVYCELAEKEGRTPPGVHGEDFKPYLRALKSIGYSGMFTIEARWENLETQGKKASEELNRQLNAVYP
jgi:sugar phosphate isomerase/epimerase